ncbi:MAG: A/G-specific adenine glycosylase [Chlamydiota bacterium]
MDVQKLKQWFLKEKRDLPWRGCPSPYEVWISEVMLQQTQASVVIDYFFRWLEVFPTIQALAEASIDDVIKAWEGLGYYSRARNLHKAAKFLVDHYGGALPSSLEDLALIPGIGPYTAGALLSFAFHKKAAAVDGNVIRVISRFFCIEDDVSKLATQKKIKEMTLNILPEEEPWVVMEALIELGARVCTRKAFCSRCPIKLGCQGRERAASLPYKEKKVEVTTLVRYVAVVLCGGEILVRKGGSGKVMADLYEFPYGERREVFESLGLSFCFVKDLPKEKHCFTRFRAELYPSLWKLEEKQQVPGCEWVFLEDASKLPFSSGHRRILQGLVNEYFTH